MSPLFTSHWLKIKPLSVVDPRFSGGRSPNSQSGCASLLFGQFFPKKMHQIERIWMRPWSSPLVPQMIICRIICRKITFYYFVTIFYVFGFIRNVTAMLQCDWIIRDQIFQLYSPLKCGHVTSKWQTNLNKLNERR